MEQLTALDAGFLEAEDSDRHASLAIGAIAVLDGPMPNPEAVMAALSERVATAPRLHQLLHMQPLDLGAPQWVEDTNFDASHHIRHAALPQPGDDAALYRWAADVMERRLDRDRPLWECWIVDGLQNGRWAILLKVHHCIADGIAATRLLSRLCDGGGVTGEGGATSNGQGNHRFPPHRLDRQGVADVECDCPSPRFRPSTGPSDIVTGLLRPAAATSLTGPVTSMRRYAAGEVSLGDVDLGVPGIRGDGQ